MAVLLTVVLAAPGARADEEHAGYEPEAGLVEIGVFGGAHIFPDEHQLFDANEKDHLLLDRVGATIGLRLGYYPLAWLGLEGEGVIIPASLDAPGGATVWSGRGHLLAQASSGRFSPFILAGYGALGVFSDALGDDIDGAFHWGVGLKYHVADRLTLRGDLRHVLSAGYEPANAEDVLVAHHFEGLVGLSVVFGHSEPPPPDPDGDGIRGDDDKCPNEAGVAPDGCPPPAKDTDGDGIADDKDACPEVASSEPDGCPPKDSDGDGVPDKADQCPNEAGKLENGCPDPDPDKDGVEAKADQCPNEPGVPPDGCPIRDVDKDGILDANDKCPAEPETKNGFQDQDGCPDELPKEVKRFTGAIKGIKFATGSSKIDPSSYPTLDAAAKVLTDYADLRIEISGHTDNTGSAETNKKLSQARAEAVRTYLLSKGIDGGRINAVGFGPDQPVADNKTAAGRAENRRIEFKLVQD